MWGPLFASTFEGSMIGAGAPVFAIWSYCISKGYEREGIIRLNPKILSVVIGLSEEDAARAIEFLCSPDSSSASVEDDGARIVHLGGFEYAIVNWQKYQELIKRELRLARDRERKQRERAATADSSDVSAEQRTVRKRPKKSPIREDEMREEKRREERTPPISPPLDGGGTGDGEAPPPVLVAEDALPKKKKRKTQEEGAAEVRRKLGIPERPKYTPEFGAFWLRTWRKGSKMKSFRIYEAMEPADREACEAAVQEWTGAYGRRESQTRPNVTTWLNDRGWENDLEAELERGRDPMKGKRFQGGIDPELGW